jgi:hypothetical protein
MAAMGTGVVPSVKMNQRTGWRAAAAGAGPGAYAHRRPARGRAVLANASALPGAAGMRSAGFPPRPAEAAKRRAAARFHAVYARTNYIVLSVRA